MNYPEKKGINTNYNNQDVVVDGVPCALLPVLKNPRILAFMLESLPKFDDTYGLPKMSKETFRVYSEYLNVEANLEERLKTAIDYLGDKRLLMRSGFDLLDRQESYTDIVKHVEKVVRGD